MTESIVVIWESEDGQTVVLSDSVDNVVYLDDSTRPDDYVLQILQDYLVRNPKSDVVQGIIRAIEEGNK